MRPEGSKGLGFEGGQTTSYIACLFLGNSILFCDSQRVITTFRTLIYVVNEVDINRV